MRATLTLPLTLTMALANTLPARDVRIQMRAILMPRQRLLGPVTTTVAPDVRIPLLTIMIQQRPLIMAVVRFLDAPFLKLAILTQKPLSSTVLAILNLASMQAARMKMLATTTQRRICLTVRAFSLVFHVTMKMT